MQVHTLRFIIAVLLTIVVMLYFYTDREKKHYSQSAEPAVAQILAEISTWEKEPLLRHLAPEARQTITDEQLEQLLDHYRSFGRFYSIDELDFSRTASAFSLFGEKRLNYSGVADYSTGPINVNITLVERGGYYLVYNFTLSRASD
ncbi:hypothetical protein [Nitrosomonas sp.]|uniref:hypothetical protein n=1 Tax=Nitrosomonas sp. TaxID=42353 RepID=UPI001D52D1F7|nr:hypothetical protein [Nitrosomonas sp.]MCB1948051.1 hypothetical protein [Nitrosomonas sp.]MCP5243493.1 hypothetical protein [Burkholderiales bacterium]MDR4513524.1 hypothetical protein [Nitrosomonas sp.]